MMFVYILQRMKKKQTIIAIESAVYELAYNRLFSSAAPCNKGVRVIVQQVQQFVGIADNAFPLPPGNGCRQKTCNFYIFFTAEPMRNLNGVGVDKIGVVVLIYAVVE